VSLADEDASVVNRLSKTLLKDLGLQSALHDSLGAQLKDIIEGVFLISHEAEALKAPNERGGLEKALGVLRIKGEQGTGSLSNTPRHHDLDIDWGINMSAGLPCEPWRA
jgi:hypothetical protein